MTRRPTNTEPQPANLSEAQIRQAIPKLKRRLDELQQLKIEDLRDDTYKEVLRSLVLKIQGTLEEIFGNNSTESRRYVIRDLDNTPIVVRSSWVDARGGGSRDNLYTHLEGIKSGVQSAVTKLQSAVDTLSERIEPEQIGGPSQIIRAYEGLELHAEIARAASKLFSDGHYANAVEAAVKALNGLVRERSGLDVDGTTLMERAFSVSNPILRFNDLSDQNDKDEQKGFMMLFSGAVTGLRNPRAHAFIHDEPERALEFIAFVSLLAKLLDEAPK